MTNEQIELLWQKNILVLTEMDTTPAALIKAVLLAVEKNGPAYVELIPFQNNVVKFKTVEGDDHLIYRCANAVGAVCEQNQLRAGT